MYFVNICIGSRDVGYGQKVVLHIAAWHNTVSWYSSLLEIIVGNNNWNWDENGCLVIAIKTNNKALHMYMYKLAFNFWYKIGKQALIYRKSIVLNIWWIVCKNDHIHAAI